MVHTHTTGTVPLMGRLEQLKRGGRSDSLLFFFLSFFLSFFYLILYIYIYNFYHGTAYYSVVTLTLWFVTKLQYSTCSLFVIEMHGKAQLLGSIVVSIPACHAGDRGSIPRRGEGTFCPFILFYIFHKISSSFFFSHYSD